MFMHLNNELPCKHSLCSHSHMPNQVLIHTCVRHIWKSLLDWFKHTSCLRVQSRRWPKWDSNPQFLDHKSNVEPSNYDKPCIIFQVHTCSFSSQRNISRVANFTSQFKRMERPLDKPQSAISRRLQLVLLLFAVNWGIASMLWSITSKMHQMSFYLGFITLLVVR